jgi:Putative auto-transporter adhesin, head GIN domain
MRARLVPAVVALMLFTASCSVTSGSGTLASESRPVSGFNAVEISGTGELSIEQTGTESLKISAEDNILPLLTSEVSGGTLKLEKKRNAFLRTTKPITYQLTVKDLTRLEISGSATVRASQLKTPSLGVEISGSGEVTAAGTADDQELEISGSGRYDAGELGCKSATIDISGSGNATVNVSDVLNVQISGSGSVTYSGNPQLSQDISGSGRLIKK